MSFCHNLLLLIGRVCISVLFLWAAGTKITNWQTTLHIMKSKGMPLPNLLLSLGTCMQLLGGMLLLLGLYARIAALILIAFLIPALLKFHDFWRFTGEQRITERTFFMKDIAILGSLFLILACGGGLFSLTP